MSFKRVFLRNTQRFVIIDEEMFDIISAFHWYQHHSGYAVAKFKGKMISMHRFLMFEPHGLCVDHINRKRRDNRFSNLRACPKGVNSFNSTRQKNNTSGFKGVSFHKKNSRWTAYIGKSPLVYLGSYATATEAAHAYNKAAQQRYGEYACLNVIKASKRKGGKQETI